MAEVNLTIDGRSYPVACDDGQERRLMQLGSYVDQRMREASVSGSSNKVQAMVLASLMLADEVFDVSEKLTQARETIQNSPPTNESDSKIEYQGLSPNDEQNVINLIGQMASKVEKLTARIQKKSA
ncbi:MAG TPA: cell division protein ZapA [Rhodospirillaceae bacterium]|nr:cell division protein ZapA [Rhodospirillaceae bacterium]